jgi:hypothetical protein
MSEPLYRLIADDLDRQIKLGELTPSGTPSSYWLHADSSRLALDKAHSSRAR